MPPADEPQPSIAELDQIVGWIEKDFLAAECAKQESSAPVVMRRLNRREYNNTIRDLLGLDLHLADGFPADDIGFGFDNVGSALRFLPSMSRNTLKRQKQPCKKRSYCPTSLDFPRPS